MVGRPSIWLGVLVLFLLAGLLLLEWQDTLVQRTVLVEVDNRSGRALERISARWAGGERSWPGVEDGESALIPLIMERPGEVMLTLAPPRQTISRRVEPGQRLYIKVGQGETVVSQGDDPSLE